MKFITQKIVLILLISQLSFQGKARAEFDFSEFFSDNKGTILLSLAALTATGLFVYAKNKKDKKKNTSTSPGSTSPYPEYKHSLVLDWDGDVISVDKILQRQFRFKDKVGPDFGKSILVVWDDNTRLYVPDTRNMILGANARKFVPGGQYSNSPEIPCMSVLAERGSKANKVTIYYNQ